MIALILMTLAASTMGFRKGSSLSLLAVGRTLQSALHAVSSYYFRIGAYLPVLSNSFFPFLDLFYREDLPELVVVPFHQHSLMLCNHGVSLLLTALNCRFDHQSRTPFISEIGPPPDLPSLLLSNRIIYIGMPLVPSVTELVIAQLLYLNYQNDQTITIYLNSPGTNSPDGKAYSFDTEAFAIADTMQFIRPPIRTICVGQAYGTAAMLLSLGQKGNRFALPNASIMLNQPRSRARGQASDVAIKAKEIMNNRRVTNEFLAMVRPPPLF